MSVDFREAFPCSSTTDNVHTKYLGIARLNPYPGRPSFRGEKEPTLAKVIIFDASYRQIKIRNFLGELGEKQWKDTDEGRR